MNIYNFHDYSDSGNLKVSFPMWLLMLFSLRHILLLVGLSITSFSHAIELMGRFTNETHWVYFISDIPGLLVLVAAFNRNACSGYAFSWIWQRGRPLLATALTLHIAMYVYFAGLKPAWHPSITESILLLDIVGLIFIYKSRRMSDVFLDHSPVNTVAITKSRASR